MFKKMKKKIFIILGVIIFVFIVLFLLLNKKEILTEEEKNICTEEFKPVCGDNGKTYANTCKALISGVGIEKNFPCEDMSEEKIKNATYQLVSSKEYVKLEEGSFSRTIGEETLTAGIVGNFYLAHDFDNDGTNDAAVVIYSNYGGSGTFIELAILSNIENPVYWTGESLGDRVVVNSLSFENNLIVLNLKTHAESDPLCCPTQETILKYKLAGTKLIKQ